MYPKELNLPTGSLNITESLFLALQRFRLEYHQVRYLWAGAVCINQEDKIEKVKQVILMGDIYRSAQNVLIWLGLGDDYSGNFINTKERIAAQANHYGIQRAVDGPILGNWAGLTPPTGAVKEALENLSIEYDGSGSDTFYSLPWFSRMWIVQELALARSAHLFYGESDISWDDFMLAAHVDYRSVQRVTKMNLRLPYNFSYVIRLVEGIRHFKNQQLAVKLFHFLSTFRRSNCSDARDRLYSMLSLKGTEDVKVTPEYNKLATLIYIDRATEMLQKDPARCIHIICFAGIARRLCGEDRMAKDAVHSINSMPAPKVLCKDLPSWVPDWSITGDYKSFHANQPIRFDTYRAAFRFRSRHTD